MARPPPSPPPRQPAGPTTVTVDFVVDGQKVHAALPVPAGPTTVAGVLPALRTLTDAMVDAAVVSVTATGAKVSCSKGCGACCRQLVPVTPVEAQQLRALVERLPEPRCTAIRTRFAAALSKLESSGLRARLAARAALTREERRTLGLAYFFQGIACPFLEDEACSIYHERPLACREFLVTSPPANCAQPSAETVTSVPMQPKVSHALARLGAAPGTTVTAWVPLTFALVEPPPAAAAKKPGTEWLRDTFTYLAGKDLKDEAPG